MLSWTRHRMTELGTVMKTNQAADVLICFRADLSMFALLVLVLVVVVLFSTSDSYCKLRGNIRLQCRCISNVNVKWCHKWQISFGNLSETVRIFCRRFSTCKTLRESSVDRQKLLPGHLFSKFVLYVLKEAITIGSEVMFFSYLMQKSR